MVDADILELIRCKGNWKTFISMLNLKINAYQDKMEVYEAGASKGDSILNITVVIV